MNSFEKIQSSFISFLHKNFTLSDEVIKAFKFELNCEQDKQQFGDINSNIAMIAAKNLKTNPRILAQQIIDGFKDDLIIKIEVAGPGFLNFFMKQSWFEQLANEIYSQNDLFFSKNYL